MPDTPIQRTCTTCTACLREDHGYSNWTVTETYLYCLRGLNPALDGSEAPYGEPTPQLAAALDVALTCPRYTAGTPAWLDVDRESIPYPRPEGPITPDMLTAYADDPEVRALLAAHLNGET